MPSSIVQPSFAAGVLGPGLYGRIDTQKYDVGLKVGRNVFIHTHGGVSNRAGTEFIAEVWDNTKEYRLIPFQRDENDNYVMVMGDQDMRLIYSGAWVESGGSPYTPSTPFADNDLWGLDYVQSIDVMYFTSRGYHPKKMSRSSLTSWTFANLQVNPTVAVPTGASVTPVSSGSETYRYKVSAVDGGVEGFATTAFETTAAQDLSISGAENVLSWTGTADEYNVYRERNGVYGYIGFTTETTFTDDNISANLEITPVESSDPFATSDDYPAKVGLYQQRLVFASTASDVENILTSKAGDYENFTRSRVLRSDDRISLNLSGPQINRATGLLSLRELLIFTTAGEFSLTGPDGALTATNPVAKQYGYAGSIDVHPLVVDDSVLFVDRTGRTVRDLRYAFEQDGYAGNDLTVFASHFFERKQVKDWAFAQSPFSIIWTVLDDGTLLSLTYKREHQVWAWCEHDVGGEVQSVAVVREGTQDAVYLLVSRTINGQSKKYIERLNARDFVDVEDAYFVDCGITYSGAATSTITGLDHLEGETVAALADGSVVTDLVVTSGQVTLPSDAEKVHVGLPFTAEIETLPPAINLKDVGAARGRPHSIPSVRVQVERTRGIEAAGATGEYAPLIVTGPDLSLPFEMQTGMMFITVGSDWNTDGTVRIRQQYPLPMTILGISPEVSIGRAG